MTKRPYDPALKAEVNNLLKDDEAFKRRQAERERQREATRRKIDAAILNSDPLPPPDDAA